LKESVVGWSNLIIKLWVDELKTVVESVSQTTNELKYTDVIFKAIMLGLTEGSFLGSRNANMFK